MIKLKENKGILLISTFVVAVVISVMSTAYITGSLVLNQGVQIQRTSLQSFYAAEKGIEYAYVESQNNNWDWVTHEVANTDLDRDGQINDLTRRDASPLVTLSGAGINTNPNSDCPGCYEITTGEGRVQVKAYADPERSGETVVLSRNTTGAVSRILKFRISRRSLYRYFYYYPRDRTLSGTMLDGKGVGGIYVKGNIGLGGGVMLSNITELSTNTSGNIYLTSSQYTQPYQLDNKIGAIDGKAPLPSQTSPYIYSTDNPYPWQNGNWPPNTWPPMDWRNVDSHFSRTTISGRPYAASINGILLPRNSWPTYWDWNKYSGTTIPASEAPVQFYDANNQPATAAYWNSLQAAYGINYFDASFWSAKTYQRAPQTVSVNYFNTDKQPDDWNAWLNSTGINLKGIVKEKNTGGYDTVIPNIQASYSTLAKEGGLYIGQDASGQTEVYLNGENLGSYLPTWITDNVQFFNTVRPKDRDGDGTVDKESVLELDISQSLNSADIPNNGIIYVASKNLRVVNARRIPEGLTIVSPYNVYIKGNYNNPADTDDWKPSAVITNSMVYFLSNNFNDPQRLPAYIYPRRYPYELQWIDLSRFTPGNTPAQIQNMETMETEIERFFGLRTNYEISAPGQQPANLSGLLNGIRSKYTADYQSQMPNVAGNPTNPVTFNVAIASPYEPTGYQLERWTGASPGIKIKGAFLQLESSWVNDANGNPIRDVPANYSNRRADYDGNIIPRPNDRGQDPASDANLTTQGRTPFSEYEERFLSERPSGDFFAASEPLWEETSDFDHDT